MISDEDQSSGRYLHDVSADERNEDHECPARNNSQSPENVSYRNCKMVFGKLSIKWMEISRIRFPLSVFLIGLKIGEGLDGGSCRVQVKITNFNWSWRGSNINDPEVGWPCSPGVAKNWLAVAIDVAEMRCPRLN